MLIAPPHFLLGLGHRIKQADQTKGLLFPQTIDVKRAIEKEQCFDYAEKAYELSGFSAGLTSFRIEDANSIFSPHSHRRQIYLTSFTLTAWESSRSWLWFHHPGSSLSTCWAESRVDPSHSVNPLSHAPISRHIQIFNPLSWMIQIPLIGFGKHHKSINFLRELKLNSLHV